MCLWWVIKWENRNATQETLCFASPATPRSATLLSRAWALPWRYSDQSGWFHLNTSWTTTVSECGMERRGEEEGIYIYFMVRGFCLWALSGKKCDSAPVEFITWQMHLSALSALETLTVKPHCYAPSDCVKSKIIFCSKHGAKSSPNAFTLE